MLSELAFDSHGLSFVIREQKVCVIDGNGDFKVLLRLPVIPLAFLLDCSETDSEFSSVATNKR